MSGEALTEVHSGTCVEREGTQGCGALASHRYRCCLEVLFSTCALANLLFMALFMVSELR